MAATVGAETMGSDMADQSATIDDYISRFPKDIQIVLTKVRRTIHNVVPEADEAISYRIPAMTLNGKFFVYFAAWKHHLSVYPIPTGDDAFEREIAPHRAGKGTLKFPFDQPIPYDLIERQVVLLAHQRADGRA